MKLLNKNWAIFLGAAALVLFGCKTTQNALEDQQPTRTIDNPYDEKEYQKMSDGFIRDMEIWRKDPESVTQVEIYKLEGKNAVILDRKVIETTKDHHVLKVTTRKYIYVFYLDLPQYIQQAWWITRVEIYALPSQRAEDNPGLQGPMPEMHEPSTLKHVDDPSKDPAPPDQDSVLP